MTLSLEGKVAGVAAPQRLARLAALGPAFFAVPFGLSGLAAGWSVAERPLGVPAAVADVLLVLSAMLWSVLLVGLLLRLKRVPRAVAAQLRDPVIGPFMALPGIVALELAAGLLPHAAVPAKGFGLAALLVVVLLAGWLTGQWIAGEVEMAQLHPGYFLPAVAGGFVGAGVAAAMGYRTIAWLCFGIGALSWLLVGSTILNRLFLGPRLPDALLPTLAIQVAPPAVGGNAYFAVHSGPDDALTYMLAGYCLLMVVVQLRLIPLYRRLAFAASFWAFTFSYCAVGTYTLQWIVHAHPAHARLLAWPVLVTISGLVILVALRSALAIRSGTFFPLSTAAANDAGVAGSAGAAASRKQRSGEREPRSTVRTVVR